MRGSRVKGLERIKRNMRKASAGYQAALAAALYQEGQEIIGEAQERTPVDVGRLRSTGYAAPPSVTITGKPECEIGFGTDYGLAVHERVEVFHVVGGPKFLESAVNDAQKGYRKRVGDQTEHNFQLGIGVRAVPKHQPATPDEGDIGEGGR